MRSEWQKGNLLRNKEEATGTILTASGNLFVAAYRKSLLPRKPILKTPKSWLTTLTNSLYQSAKMP